MRYFSLPPLHLLASVDANDPQIFKAGFGDDSAKAWGSVFLTVRGIYLFLTQYRVRNTPFWMESQFYTSPLNIVRSLKKL